MMRFFIFTTICVFTTVSAYAADIVGLTLPLDSRLSPVAKRMEFGAQLAVEKLKQQGHDVELVLADDGCDVQKAPELAKSFSDAQVDIVVGAVCFRLATELAKEFKNTNSTPIPVVATNTRNKLLPRLRDVDELNLYSLSNAPDAEAKAIVDLVLPRFQNRPFAILDDGSVYGRALADDLRELSEQTGTRAVVNSNFRPLQTTQIAMLRRLKKSGVEAVFIAAAAEDVVTIANDIRTLKLDWMVATGERGQLLPYSVTQDSNMAGMLMVGERNLATKELSKKVGNLGDLELENSLLLGHAQIEIGAQAARLNLTSLVGQTFDTIIGPVTFDQEGRAAPNSFVLHQWQDGAFEIVKGN